MIGMRGLLLRYGCSLSDNVISRSHDLCCFAFVVAVTKALLVPGVILSAAKSPTFGTCHIRP